MTLDTSLVLVAAFLLLCVAASKVSAKLGIPAIVFFAGIGMLAGSDGPGGIHFSDVGLTKSVGNIALAFILFAGGLESKWSELRPVMWRSLSIATVGVVVTAALVAGFAYQFVGFAILPALLLGAIVSSTDAAAVFGILRTSGLQLKYRVTPLLEFESGTNDPLAAFLTTAIIGLITHPQNSPWLIVPRLLMEVPIGAAIGLLAGYGGTWLINKLRLEYDGLYPAITIATACLAFGGAGLAHGSAFLSVYVAGLVMGSRNFLHRTALLQFHDGLAWLLQIVMFVVLGLLVFPKQLLTIAVPGILLALFLIVVARPIAVYVSFAFAKMPHGAKLFIGWAGLRGAVPIILATFPLIEGVPEAERIFNLVFFIVLLSVLIQGTTLPAAAKLLGLLERVVPANMNLQPLGHKHLFEVVVAPESTAIGKQVIELNLPSTCLLVLLTRGEDSYLPKGATVLEGGDTVLVATRREDEDELRAHFN